MIPHRISSTQITTFEECPMKWALTHVGREEAPAGKAAAVGSIFHAAMEVRLSHPDAPPATLADVRAQPGNYQHPRALLAHFGDEALWPLASRMASAVGDPWAYLPPAEAYPVLFVEYDLDEAATPLLDGAFVAGGYIDLLLLDGEDPPRAAMVIDWKTRGKKTFATRPRGADFDSNRQLVYYAAAVSRAFPSLETVEVSHINVLRPDKAGEEVEIAVESWAFSRERLDQEWAWLEDTLLPAMAATRTAFLAAQDVDTNRESCFKYGRCPVQNQCNRHILLAESDPSKPWSPWAF